MTDSPDRGSFTTADWCVCAVIAAVGALQFILCERASDFPYSDVSYVELAKSLLRNGTYSFNFVTEKLQPPGWPVTLALVCSTVGCTHDTLVRTVPVFLASGFLLSYTVLRNQIGRATAAAICLLLAASPAIFPYATRVLWPSFPYFFFSMLFLLLAQRFKPPKDGLQKILIGCLLCFLLTAALLIQSVGIALIGALLGWAVLLFLRDSPDAKIRLKFAVPVILVALLVQTLWFQRGGNPRDWPLPGYPGSYFSQLMLRSGNDPELGLASPKDLVLRVGKNLEERVAFLAEVLTHHWVTPSLASPLIAGLIVLILAGIWSSLLRSNSQLCALYFVGYEFIYLLWPWSFDVPRFTIPVLPLSCLYLVEGVLALQRWMRQYPRVVALVFLLLSVVLAFLAVARCLQASVRHGIQDTIAPAFWIFSSAVWVKSMRTGSLLPSEYLRWVQGCLGKRYSVVGLSLSPVAVAGAFVLTCLVATSVAADVCLGLENLSSGQTKLANTPEIQAAAWIRSHTDPNAVIASRHVELVYHYSGRRVIWFPPISNPQVLMEGIRSQHINYVIVVDRKFDYYQPSDAICFELLYKRYLGSFRLVETNGPLRIYQVREDPGVPPAGQVSTVAACSALARRRPSTRVSSAPSP